MAGKHVKTCPLFIIREMQSKTTMKYLPLGTCRVHIKMAKIKHNSKCWQEQEANRIVINHWWECKMVHPIWRRVCTHPMMLYPSQQFYSNGGDFYSKVKMIFTQEKEKCPYRLDNIHKSSKWEHCIHNTI